MLAIARNSLCQFWNDSNQNDAEETCSQSETGSPPCPSCSSLCARVLPSACATKDARNSAMKASDREREYSASTQPPRRTGQGASRLLRDTFGSRSTFSVLSGSLDSDEPRWNRITVSIT